MSTPKLVRVQGDMELATPAAAAWFALVDDAVESGHVAPVLSSPAGAWRSEEMVVDMWRHPAKYGASQGTARPISYGGGGSVHQNGLCVDVNNWRAFGGLVVHRGFRRSSVLDGLCAAHGFHMDARYPNEPWHYQHNGLMPAGAGVDPLPVTSVPEGIIEMDTILLALGDGLGKYGPVGKTYYALYTPSTGRVWDFEDPDLANQLVLKYGQTNRETGKPTGSAFNAIKYAEWESIHEQANRLGNG